MTRFEEIAEKIRKLYECPDCHGEGGYTEVITDDGMGPHYTCGFCNGKGTMNVFKRIYLLVLFKKWELQDRRRLEKDMPKRKLIASARTRREIIKRIAEYFHGDPINYRLDGYWIYFRQKRETINLVGFWVIRKWGRYWFEAFGKALAGLQKKEEAIHDKDK
jgi:hypothetical protein